jgi:hypothetical protein
MKTGEILKKSLLKEKNVISGDRMKTTKTGRRTFKTRRSGSCGKSCSGTHKKRSFWSKLFRWLFGASTKAKSTKGKRYSSRFSGRKRVSLRAKKSKTTSSYRRNKKMAA